MAMSPKLELKQSQQLAMTPQLQQAIKLLQMTNIELAEFLGSELERNPFLEIDSGPGSGMRPSESAVPAFRNAQPPRPDFDLSLAENLAAPVSLHDHITSQLGTMPAPRAVTAVALLLVYELDDQGYLDTPVSEIAARNSIAVAVVEQGLELLQSCNPTGVGARSLVECLRLQLGEAGQFDSVMNLLLDNIGLAARNDVAALARKTSLPAVEVQARLDIIRSLDPRPGLQFSAATSSDRIPDIVVSQDEKGGWLVELTTNGIPRLLVNNRYMLRVSADGAVMPANLREMSRQASWLLRTLDHRAKTILRVASCIVKLQASFFQHGAGHLRPMTLKSVATEIGAHESTVSRAVSGKYLQCSHGIFALKSLFSQSVAALNAGPPQAAANVRHRIGRLVRAESPQHVLSDDQIVSQLREEGIDIARRTVAKYRTGLRIPPSAKRRRNNSVKSQER